MPVEIEEGNATAPAELRFTKGADQAGRSAKIASTTGSHERTRVGPRRHHVLRSHRVEGTGETFAVSVAKEHGSSSPETGHESTDNEGQTRTRRHITAEPVGPSPRPVHGHRSPATKTND